MLTHRIGLAFVVVGMTMEACASGGSDTPLGSGQDSGPGLLQLDGGADAKLLLFLDGSFAGTGTGTGSFVGSGSSGGSGSGSGSSGGGGSGTGTGSGSSSGGSSVDSGQPSSAAGYAIPLAAPGGPDFEYTAQVTVGNQSFVMSIDTGSSTAAPISSRTCCWSGSSSRARPAV